MNDNHPQYIERWLSPSTKEAVNNYKVVVLTGARQVGKSTFLKHCFDNSQWKYISFDDLEALELAQKRPKDLIDPYNNLIIDEVQKSPKFLSAVKLAVDSSNKKFILSGSANLLLMHKVSESLAGRAVYKIMHPMTYGETVKKSASNLLSNLFDSKGKEFSASQKINFPKLSDMLLQGFMPPVIAEFNKIKTSIGWLEGFVSTFLERDLQQLSQIENLPDFRRLMGILALRSGQLLNQSEVGRDAAIPQATVHRYVNLLETAFLIEKIPAFSINRTKRLIKTPKIYWFDTGLCSFLMGHHSPEEITQTREWGALFETFILMNLKTWAELNIPAIRIYYWRTTTGQEVDFILESGKRLIAIEVKASSKISLSDAKNLRIFMDEYPECCAGLIAYSGKEIVPLGSKIWACPWQYLV